MEHAYFSALPQLSEIQPLSGWPEGQTFRLALSPCTLTAPLLKGLFSPLLLPVPNPASSCARRGHLSLAQLFGVQGPGALFSRGFPPPKLSPFLYVIYPPAPHLPEYKQQSFIGLGLGDLEFAFPWGTLYYVAS